nr:ankyrin repeat domain-containing protein [Devriesea agamarum]
MLNMARDGEAEDLLPLLDRGAPVNMLDAKGNSLLMLAAYYDHAELVRELAERGGDVDLANDRGQTPLAGAVFKGFDQTVKTLLDLGANPDLGTPSARETAAFFQHTELAALIEDSCPAS